MSIPLFCRLTTDQSNEEVQNLLQICPRYVKGIISHEKDANREHKHIFIMTNESNPKNARQNLRNLIKKGFPSLFGNSCFAITKVETEYSKLLSYVVKEGDFVYWGYTADEVAEFVKKSFSPNKDKESYKSEKKLLEDSFFSSDMPSEDFVRSFFNLRIKYDKMISANQAETYFEHMIMKRSPVYLDRRVDWHIDRLFRNYN